MNKVLQPIEEIIGELDYMYQEGVIFSPEDVEQLGRIYYTVQGIYQDLTNEKMQEITRQVRKD